LLYHRIIIDDIRQTIAGNVGEGKRNECSGGDETGAFLSFSDGPQEFVGFSMEVQVESEWVVVIELGGVMCIFGVGAKLDVGVGVGTWPGVIVVVGNRDDCSGGYS
jgi:hypothetical protein